MYLLRHQPFWGRFNRSVKRLGGVLVLSNFLSVFVLRPLTIFATNSGAASFLKLISVTIIAFQIKQVALVWDLNLLDAAFLSFTRDNGDSTTPDVSR